MRERNKKIFKNCALFTNCISKISNTQIDNNKDTDVLMPISSLIEYSDNYLETSGSVWQYYRNEPDDDEITDSESFSFEKNDKKHSC